MLSGRCVAAHAGHVLCVALPPLPPETLTTLHSFYTVIMSCPTSTRRRCQPRRSSTCIIPMTVHQRCGGSWGAAKKASTAAAMFMLAANSGAQAFRATPRARGVNRNDGDNRRASGVTKRPSAVSRARCSGNDRWILRSSGTGDRGQGREASIGSGEDNNWGMDDSIDVNAIRVKMMKEAGYALRDDENASEEWVTIDEDGSDAAIDQMADALADSLTNDLLGDGSTTGTKEEVSKVMGDLIQDTDMSKFFDEEFEKGTSALRALADELKTEQGSTSYADTMASELAELFQAEEEKAAKEIEEREGPVKAKLEEATAQLEDAMAEAKEARAAFEGDFFLQLMSFRQKGVPRQAAFVAAVLIANQAVYQAILVAGDRDGNPAIALGGLAVSAALVWVYGYRPFSF